MSEDDHSENVENVGMDSLNEDFNEEAEAYSPQPTVSAISCEFCGKCVKTKNGLHKHKRRYHDSERRMHMKFLCSEGCSTGFPHLNLLRNHYSLKHELPATQITAEFPSVECFEQWKENEEQTTCTKFIVKDRRTAGQKGKTRIMYWCHRSGEASESKVNSKPKNPRIAAKTGVICTAAINCFINVNGTVDMTYYPDHWGHENDAQYLFLSKEQRQDLAHQLQSGLSPAEVMEQCHNSDNLRLQKVNRTTLYRVCRDFDLPWTWGKQRSKSSEKNSPEEEDEYDSTEFDESCSEQVSGILSETNHNRASKCLERISDLLAQGAFLTEDDLEFLEAMEKRLAQQLEATEAPTECVVILDSVQLPQDHSTLQAPLAPPVVTTFAEEPPRDLNVAIINYDGY